MTKYNLAVIIPGVRVENWKNIYFQIAKSVGESYTFQLICVGPNLPPIELQDVVNFIYIRDFGAPSRCFQLGSTVANAEYMCFLSDDGIVESNALGTALDLIKTKTAKDGLTLLYSEGPHFTGNQHLQPEYWTTRHHDSLHLPLINLDWKIAPCFMYNLEYYRSLGGLDCRWEHINMNTHDLAFRIQRDGGIIYPSPTRVTRNDWMPWSNDPSRKTPVQKAYEQNDSPLFEKIFRGNQEPDIKIDYDNWKNSPAFWVRKYEV